MKRNTFLHKTQWLMNCYFKYKVFFHFHLTYNAFSCKKQVQYLLQSECSRHNNIWRVSLMINVHHNLLSFNVNSKNFFINITFNSSLIKLILLDKENLLLVPQNRRIGVMNKFSGVNITKCTDYANILKDIIYFSVSLTQWSYIGW